MGLELSAEQIREELAQNEAETEAEREREEQRCKRAGWLVLNDDEAYASAARVAKLRQRHSELVALRDAPAIEEARRTGRGFSKFGDDPATPDNVTWGRTPAERDQYIADARRFATGQGASGARPPAIRRVAPQSRPRAHRPAGPRRTRAPAKAGEPSEPDLVDADAAALPPPAEPFVGAHAPTLVVEIPLEGRPRLRTISINESTRERLIEWLDAHPVLGPIVIALLDLKKGQDG